MGTRRLGGSIRWGVGCLVAGLGLAGLAPRAAAQAPGLELAVLSGQALYYPGETVTLSVRADNPGLPVSADFYAGVILPDGLTVVTVGLDGSLSLGSLADLPGLRPLALGVSLGAPFAVALDPLVQYVWTGTEPLGLYTAFLAAVQPGSLADGRLDPGDLLALQTGGLSLFQPAQATVEAGQAVSAVLTAAGGTLTATGSAGHQFRLTVPAGALQGPVTITLTPVASLTGLPLTGALLAAVQIDPAGLRFEPAATLSVTLPGGPPPPGVVGFSVNGDGTGFVTQPSGVNGATLTIPVGETGTGGVAGARPAPRGGPTPRQSSPGQTRGWGISFCGPEVTSAIGRDACREMAESLSAAATGQPGGDQSTLARTLVDQLRTWLQRFIDPEVAAAGASSPPSTDPNVDYFFQVALREYEAVRTILALAEVLDAAVSLDQELQHVHGLIPGAFAVRRSVANEQCLLDREHWGTYVQRLFNMAGLAQRLNGLEDFPPVPESVGLTCIKINLITNFPDPVPADGGAFQGIALALFADDLSSLAYPDQPLPEVTMELVASGLATITPPTRATAPSEVRLHTTVGFGAGSQTTLQFEVRVDVPDLALFRKETITRTKSCLFPPDQLPPGSYQFSCESCEVQGTTLSCQCRRIDDELVNATKDFSTCGTELANTDGVLTCGPCPTAPALSPDFGAAAEAGTCDLPA